MLQLAHRLGELAQPSPLRTDHGGHELHLAPVLADLDVYLERHGHWSMVAVVLSVPRAPEVYHATGGTAQARRTCAGHSVPGEAGAAGPPGGA